MATRFYMPSSGAAPVNPAFDPGVEETSAADRVRAVLAKSDSPLTGRTITPSNISGADSEFRMYVSDPLDAGSISGTVKAYLQAAAVPAGILASASAKSQLSIRVVSRDGLTVRGTLLALSGAGVGNNWIQGADPRNAQFAAAGTALSAVTAQQGDRIVWEISVKGGFSSNQRARVWFGHPAATADLPENQTQTTLGVPWLEFSQTLAFETGGGPPASVPPAPVGGPFTTPRLTIPWRTFLCDTDGVALADVSHVFVGKETGCQRNRPAFLSAEVRSDEPKVMALHTDGLPNLEAEVRTIKAYREEDVGGGTLAWVLRFNGYVELVEDGENDMTKVIAYDPLRYAHERFAIDSAGGIETVAFDGDEATQIARILVDRQNVFGSTGIVTDGVYDNTVTRIVEFSRKEMGAAIVELAEADVGFDLHLAPVDRDDGYLCQLNCLQQLGEDRPDVIFRWPGTSAAAGRVRDGTKLGNVLYGVGNQIITGARVDSPSTAKYRRHEKLVSFPDTTDLAYLEAQTDGELALRKEMKERVTFRPLPGKSPEPFTHFFLGDYIRSEAAPQKRGGWLRTERIEAFTIKILDGTNHERLDTVTVRVED